MSAFNTPWRLDTARRRAYSGSAKGIKLQDAWTMVDPEAGTGTCHEGATGYRVLWEGSSATTGVTATPEPVSMDTEGTQGHSSSSPSHPDTPLLHPSQIVPMGNTGTTTRATGPVADGHVESSRIGGKEGKQFGRT
ncbi:MAG: hypothetical protein J3Q66DRAFT_407204 [Benniella sp.]|nr:MAG: hypothetical protein J3Q66DRAFT_407204 [Benniella sp.]